MTTRPSASVTLPFGNRRSRAATASQLFAAAGGAIAIAAPVGAQVAGERVVAGSASFARSGNVTTITAANNTIINYNSFNIGPGEAVRFVQPDSLARVLNRINSSLPSRIDGELTANGRVYIVNPAGVYFGRGAMINVGGIFAAAAHVNDGDFLRGVDRFRTTPGGKVVNEGTIHANVVGLIGREVFNFGAIEAPRGTVMMVSGDTVTLGEQGGRVFAQIESPAQVGPPAPAGAPTTARRARFGAGDMFGVAVWNKGTAKAARVQMEAQRGQTRVEGTVDASSREAAGGEIRALGETVAVVGANLDASGATGGGTVLVGGNFQGNGPERNAQRTAVDGASTIAADATAKGDGGTVIVWADDRTNFQGSVSARGGPRGGDGGFAEISGKNTLSANTNVDLSAPLGRTGTVLYDPLNIEIRGGTNDGSDDPDPQSDRIRGDNTTGEVAFDDEGDGFVVDGSNDDPFVIFESEIEGTNADIVLQARRSITTAGDFTGDDVLVTSGRSLTLQTRNQNADGAGSIDLTTSADGTNLEFRTQGAGSISILSSTSGEASGNISLGRLRADTGSITVSAGGPADTITLANSITTGGGGIFFNGGPVSLAANMAISNGSGAGNIAFDSAATINSAGATQRNLDITAGTGSLMLGGNLGSDFQLGTLTVHSASGGVTTQGVHAASVAITGGGNVDLNGAVVANGGFSATGTGTFDNTGATIAVSNNPLTLTFDDAIVLGAALSSNGGTISVTSTGGNVSASESVNSAGGTLTLDAGTNTLAISSTVAAGAGTLNLTGGEINLTGGAATVSGTGQIVFRPATTTQAIRIGDTADSGAPLDLTATDLASLAEGFSNIVIGRGIGEHIITVAGAVSFKDAVQIQSPVAGSITVNAALDTLASATPADITLNTAGAAAIDGAVSSGGGAVSITGSTVTSSAAIASGAGVITLTGDEIDLGANVAGLSTITLQPVSPTREITVGGNIAAGGRLNLLDAEVSRLQEGFTRVTIGRSNSTGDVFVAASGATFRDTLELRTPSGGAISIAGTLSTAGSADAANMFLSAGSGVTQAAGILTDSLTLSGSGAFTLNSAANAFDALFGTVAGSVTARNSTAFSAGVGGTALAATGSGNDLTLTSDAGSITIGAASATDAAVISAAASIVDDNSGSTSLTAATATLVAGGDIGTAAGGELETQIATLTATTTNGEIAIVEADGVVLSGVTAGGTGKDIRITSTTGDITVESVTAAGDTVTIIASGTGVGSGNIFDDDNDATSISAGEAILTAGDGSVGTSAPNAQIDTDVAILRAMATNGSVRVENAGAMEVELAVATGSGANDIVISNTAGNITAGDLNADDGVTITSAAGILDDGDSDTSVGGTTVNLTALAGSIGNSDALETSAGTLNAAVSGGGIHIDESDHLTLNTITATGAGTNNVEIIASGTITVRTVTADDAVILTGNEILDDAVNSTTISGTTATLTAFNGSVGTAGNRVDTDVDEISLDVTNGSIFIENVGTLLIDDVTATGAGTNDVTVTALAGNLTLGTVNAADTATLSAPAGSILDDGDTGAAATKVSAVTISLTSAGSIGAANAGAVDINAVTLSAATTNGSVFIEELNSVALAAITAGGGGNQFDLRAAAIADDAVNSTFITADTVSLTASAGSIGASGANNEIDTQTNTLTAISTNGSVFVTDADAVTVATASATGTGTNDVTIITTTGDLTASVIAAENTVALTATAGSVLDDANNTTRIAGATVNLSAANGSVGASGVNNEIDTTASTIGVAATNGSVFLGELDGVTFATLSATGSGTNNATITNGSGDIVLTTGTVEDTLTVTSAGAILDDGTTAKQGAGAAILNAATSIGTSATPLGTNVASIDATALAGGVFLLETNDITLTSIVATGSGNDVSVANEAGAITVVSVVSPDDVSLQAAGAIVDDGNDATFISGDALTLQAVGSIGASAAPGMIDTAVASVSAATTGGSVFLNEADAIALTSMAANASGQDITVTAGGDITVFSVSAADAVVLDADGAGSDIVDDDNSATVLAAATATLTADGAVGGAGAAALETAINSLTASAGAGGVFISESDGITLAGVTAAGAGNDVSVTSTTGNIIVATIDAPDAIVLAASAGSIVDDGNDATFLTAATATLTASANVGTTGGSAALDTALSSLNAHSNAAGQIAVANTGAIDLLDVDTANGAITVSATGALTATDIQAGNGGQVALSTSAGDVQLGAVLSTGTVVITATSGAIAEIGAGDSATDVSGSTITLSARDAIGGAGELDIETDATILNAGSSSTGNITITEANAVTLAAVSTASGNISISSGAQMTASAVVANGGGVTLSTGSGNLIIDSVSATGTAALTAAGSIVEPGTGDGAVDITAPSVGFSSGGTIGSSGTSLDLATATIAASAAGDINLSEADAIAINGLASTNGNITFGAGGATTVVGAINAATGSVLVQSSSAIAVNADVAAGSSIAFRAASGTGAITFGGGDVDITANVIELNAGNGFGGAVSSATVDARTNAPEFRPASGAAVTTMTIQQGPQIADALLPTAAQFLGVPPQTYRLISEDAGVTISDASLVNGTHLNLTGSPIQIIPDINVLSLTTTGGSVSVRGVRTTAGNITLGGPATITGGELNAGTSTINLQSTAAGASGVPLLLIADEIELAGTVSGNSSILLEPSSSSLDVFVGGTTDPGSGLWLSQNEINNLQNGFTSITIGNPFGSGLLNVVGNVTFSDPVTLQMPGGNAAFDALVVGNDDASVSVLAPQIALNTGGGIGTSAGDILVDGDAIIASAALLDSTNGGSSSSGANIRITGDVESDGAAGRTLALNAGTSGNIGLDGDVGIATTVASLTAIGASVDLRQVRTSGSQTYTGATMLRGPLTSTQAGGITITGDTTLATNTVITTAGAASTDFVLLNGAVDSDNLLAPRSLSINAGAGGVATMGGAAGAVRPLASLAMQGGNVSIQSVTTDGSQAYVGATTLNGNLTSALGAISVNGPTLLVAPAVNITAGGSGAAVNFGGVVQGASALAITAPSGNVNFAGDVSGLTSLASTAGLTSLSNVSTSSDQMYTGNVVLNGNLATTDGGDISVIGTTTLTPSQLQIQAAGADANIDLQGPVSGTTDLTLNATGTARLGSNTTLASLTAAGGAIDVNAVTTTGNQTYNGPTTLRANLAAGGTITVAGSAALAAPSLAINAVSDIAFLVDVSGLDTDLSVRSSAGNVAFSTVGLPGNFGARSLAVEGNQLSIGSVTTVNEQSYAGNSISLFGGYISQTRGILFDGPVTLLSNVSVLTLTGNDIDFTSTIENGGDFGHMFTVSAPSGAVNFAQNIGEAEALASIRVTGATISAPALIRTVGDQRYEGNLVFTAPEASLIGDVGNATITFGNIFIEGDVTAADTFLTLNSGDVTSTLAGDVTLRRLRVTGAAALGTAARDTTVSTTEGVRFESTTALLGNSTVTSAGQLYFGGNIRSEGGVPRSLTVTSGLVPSLDVDNASIVSTVPIVFGGDIGGEDSERLSALTIGSALADIPETSSILLTTFPLDANGNIILPDNFVLPDVQVAGESALLPHLRINAGNFAMGQNQKLTAFGHLTIDAGAGVATLGDMTSLGDITVNAGQIFLRPRAPGTVLTNQFSGSPLQPGEIDDDGLDFIARDSITFSVLPEFTTTGNARFATNNGAGLRIGSGGFVNDLFIQGVVFTGGVSNKLLTPRTPLGTPLTGFENTGLPLDLSSNSRNVSNVASALASAVPSAQSATVDTGTITLSSNVRKALEEMGVFTKDPMNVDDGLVQAAADGLSGSTLFSDYPDKATITINDIIKITPNRLSQASVYAALAAYSALVGPPDAERQVRVAEMQEAMDALWLEYIDTLGGVDPDPAEFVEFIRDSPDGESVLENLQRICDLLNAIDQLGLTEIETRRPKQDVLNYVRPSDMTLEQLEAAALTLEPRRIEPVTPVPTPDEASPAAPTPTDETSAPETPEATPIDGEPEPEMQPDAELPPAEQPAEEPERPQLVGSK